MLFSLIAPWPVWTSGQLFQMRISPGVADISVLLLGTAAHMVTGSPCRVVNAPGYGLVWARMKQVAEETAQTIYQVKFGQLSDYLIQQLKAPSVRFA